MKCYSDNYLPTGILFAVLWLVGTCVQAAEPAKIRVANPKSVGMSAERLARMDGVMQAFIDDGMLPGTVTLVARQGKVVQFKAQGKRWVEQDKPMQTDTIFRLASMTKPIVSVALMQLYEKGLFLLDDPITKWMPELENQTVWLEQVDEKTGEKTLTTEPARRPVTVRHILTHMSGLDSSRGLPEGAPRRRGLGEGVTTMDEALVLRAEDPLAFHPGEDWQYGGSTNYVGVLVERMSGMTLEAYCQEHILKPLGMVDTSFLVPQDKVDRLAALYRPDANKQLFLLEAPKPGALLQIPETAFMGAGGMFSTAPDYYRFAQMLLNGGELDGVRILGRRTIELMASVHSGDNDIWVRGPGYGFGLGFSVLTDHSVSEEPLSEGSFGWGGAFGTWFWIDPVEDMIGIVMTQLSNHRHVPHRMMLSVIANQAIVDDHPGSPRIKAYRAWDTGGNTGVQDDTLPF